MEVWLNKETPEEHEYIARFNSHEQVVLANSVKYYLGHKFFSARLTEENYEEIGNEVVAFFGDEDGSRTFEDEEGQVYTETATNYPALKGLYNIMSTYRDRKYKKPDMAVHTLMLEIAQKMVYATEEQIVEEEAETAVNVVDQILLQKDASRTPEASRELATV